MRQRTVYIISAKFAPGLKKEFGLLGDNLERKGLRVRYLLAEPYKDLHWNHPDTDYLAGDSGPLDMMRNTIRSLSGRGLDRVFAEAPPDAVYFYNTHPVNPVLAAAVKRRFLSARVVLHLHDPYKPDKRPYGISGAMKIRMAELVQSLTVLRADHVVFPSRYSRELFRRRYPRFAGATHVAPLLIPDQGGGPAERRLFFSMVGRMNHATGHDTFLGLVNHVADKRLGYEFALVCAGDLSRCLARVTPQGRKLLTVINRRVIDDSEIDAVLRRSYGVFRLAREVAQSGVIPVAFMNRTPVIARDIPGLCQHVRHGHDGYLVPFDCSPADLLDAMHAVQTDFARLSENARHSYETTWSELNWDACYGWLVDLLRDPEKSLCGTT